MTPTYTPRTAIISENKDTAISFPPVLGGISVEGAGTGGTTPASTDCPNIIYWGDLDADGLTILNQYREAGLLATSILMDIPTFDAHAQFGTDPDAKGNPIKISERRELATLDADERALYEQLTGPSWPGYRRIEQERTPLDIAFAAVQAAVVASAAAPA